MPGQTATEAQFCYHCALPVPHDARWFTSIDGLRRPMCCAGCQAVSQAIVDAGLDDYYRHRSAPASGPETVPPQLAELAQFDTPEAQRGFVRREGDLAEATLMLEGMRCGACQWLVERALAAQPGVSRVQIHSGEGALLIVDFDPRAISPLGILRCVHAQGHVGRLLGV